MRVCQFRHFGLKLQPRPLLTAAVHGRKCYFYSGKAGWECQTTPPFAKSAKRSGSLCKLPAAVAPGGGLSDRGFHRNRGRKACAGGVPTLHRNVVGAYRDFDGGTEDRRLLLINEFVVEIDLNGGH